MPHIHKSVAISDRSSIGEARRAAIQAALSLGFNENRRNDIGIVVTEAATNILLHAQSGELLICPFIEGDASWLDLLALDSGPGIRDLGRAMEDGFSSIGTAGQGLGAIQRLSDQASIYSIPDKGTVYWSRFLGGSASSAMAMGVLSVPIHGETVCGDSYFVSMGASRSVFMMVDGLGHGVGAMEAAHEAVLVTSRHYEESPVEIIARSHDALKKTRGAAMSIAVVDHDRRVVNYAGVGNIGASATNESGTRSFVSQSGTLGAIMPRTLQDYTYPIDRTSTLVMFSDGLTTKASIAGYPGIQNRHPALAAGVLYRDFSRKRDDATVLIAPLGGSGR